MKKYVVVGGQGAIGGACVDHLLSQPDTHVTSLVRSSGSSSDRLTTMSVDFNDETSYSLAAETIKAHGPLDGVIVATGMLHSSEVAPEKSLKALSKASLLKNMEVNLVIPALIAQSFIPILAHNKRSFFAVLSARLGSISDNRLGGWYSYRASKAALNMFVKTAAIEASRMNPHCVVVGLHPGTVDSALSRPFHGHIPASHIKSPGQAASMLMDVLNTLKPSQSGRIYAYDGTEVSP